MYSKSPGSYRREEAASYDRQAREMGWHGHEALFGLMHEYVRRGQTLLDMGIGTGLSSEPFHRAGLQVSGFDSSDEMLLACADKGFVGALVRHDLLDTPFPYADASYHHVISLAVLHLVRDLGPVFAEAGRIVRPGGIFGFSVEAQKSGQDRSHVVRGGVDDSEIEMIRHADEEVRALLDQSGFEVCKRFEFLADPLHEGGIDFKLYVSKRRGR